MRRRELRLIRHADFFDRISVIASHWPVWHTSTPCTETLRNSADCPRYQAAMSANGNITDPLSAAVRGCANSGATRQFAEPVGADKYPSHGVVHPAVGDVGGHRCCSCSCGVCVVGTVGGTSGDPGDVSFQVDLHALNGNSTIAGDEFPKLCSQRRWHSQRPNSEFSCAAISAACPLAVGSGIRGRDCSGHFRTKYGCGTWLFQCWRVIRGGDVRSVPGPADSSVGELAENQRMSDRSRRCTRRSVPPATGWSQFICVQHDLAG